MENTNTAAQPLNLDKLPALPADTYLGGDEAFGDVVRGFTAVQMREYGQACARSAITQQAEAPQSGAAGSPVSETGELIAAAEKNAEAYNGDDREGIKTDVINAFYQGAAWQARATFFREVRHTPVADGKNVSDIPLDLPELNELPRPAVTYADHSYPAFSKKQMADYAEKYAREAISNYLRKQSERRSEQPTINKGESNG